MSGGINVFKEDFLRLMFIVPLFKESHLRGTEMAGGIIGDVLFCGHLVVLKLKEDIFVYCRSSIWGFIYTQ